MFDKKQEQGDEGWLSLSDMMTVLMVIFLTIAVFASFSSPRSSDAGQLVRNEEILCKKFEKKIPLTLRRVIEVRCNPFRIIFLEPETQFDLDSSEVKQEFKKRLDEFIPGYLNELALWPNREFISEIRVEGHASPLGDHFYNLELSQKRSLNVANYILKSIVPREFGIDLLPYVRKVVVSENDKTFDQWTKEKITASGFSSTRPKYRRTFFDGKLEVDNPASQRVEIRLHVNYASVISALDTRQFDTAK